MRVKKLLPVLAFFSLILVFLFFVWWTTFEPSLNNISTRFLPGDIWPWANRNTGEKLELIDQHSVYDFSVDKLGSYESDLATYLPLVYG